MAAATSKTNGPCRACPLSTDDLWRLPEHVRRTFLRGFRLDRSATYVAPSSGHRLLIVRTGSVKVEVSASACAAHVLGFYFAGEAMALPGGTDVPMQIVALQPADLCEIDIKRAELLEPPGNGLLRAAMEVSMHQIAAEQKRWRSFRTGSAGDRLATFLADCSARSLEPADIELALPMSREDLARYLAMRPETLSRAFAELRAEGRIEMRSRFAVRLLSA